MWESHSCSQICAGQWKRRVALPQRGSGMFFLTNSLFSAQNHYCLLKIIIMKTTVLTTPGALYVSMHHYSPHAPLWFSLIPTPPMLQIATISSIKLMRQLSFDGAYQHPKMSIDPSTVKHILIFIFTIIVFFLIMINFSGDDDGQPMVIMVSARRGHHTLECQVRLQTEIRNWILANQERKECKNKNIKKNYPVLLVVMGTTWQVKSWVGAH